ERSTESLRQPIEPVEAEQPEVAPAQDEERPAAGPEPENRGELEDLLDAIKRDSGYLEFAKDKRTAQTHEEPAQPTPAEPSPEIQAEPAIAHVADDRQAAPEPEAVDEPVVASAPVETTDEVAAQEEAVAPIEATAPAEPIAPIEATDRVEPVAVEQIADA